MKIVGIVLIFLSSVGIGYLKSISLKKKVQLTDDIILFLNGYKEKVRYSSASVGDIISEFCESDRFKHFRFLQPWVEKISIGAAPKEAFLRVTQTASLPFEVQKAFTEFSGEIGRSDRQTQENLCDLYIGIFNSLKKTYLDDYENKGKLYRNFGVYIGAFLAAILF